MVKKLLFLLTISFLLILPSTIYAQTGISTDSAASRLKEQMQKIQAQKNAAVSNIKRGVKETKVELREQIRENVAAKREVAKEALATKREEFKTKLQAIKDEKKKVLVDRIDTKLMSVNTKHTDRFTHVLNNLQALLDKMSEDLEKTVAQAAIDTAKTAVENQAAKTYTIAISTETTLRSDVGTVTSQLRQDLSATHKLVVDAKQTVQALKENNAMMKKEAISPKSL